MRWGYLAVVSISCVVCSNAFLIFGHCYLRCHVLSVWKRCESMAVVSIPCVVCLNVLRIFGRCNDAMCFFSEYVGNLWPLLRCHVLSVWMRWEYLTVVTMSCDVCLNALWMFGRCYDFMWCLSECVMDVWPLLRCHVMSVCMHWEYLTVVTMSCDV